MRKGKWRGRPGPQAGWLEYGEGAAMLYSRPLGSWGQEGEAPRSAAACLECGGRGWGRHALQQAVCSGREVRDALPCSRPPVGGKGTVRSKTLKFPGPQKDPGPQKKIFTNPLSITEGLVRQDIGVPGIPPTMPCLRMKKNSRGDPP